MRGVWLTYEVIANVYNQSGNVGTVDNLDSLPNLRSFRTCLRADPRTDRWGLSHLSVFPSINSADIPSGLNALASNGVDGGYGNNAAPHYFLPQGITWKPTSGSTYRSVGAAGGPHAPGWFNPSLMNPADLMANLARSPNGNPNSGTSATAPPGAKYAYTDPDGVVRRASGWNFSGVNGLPLYTGNNNSRPVILNQPFRSVADMAYAFRDVAWKNVDFFSPESGDAALLDAFCLNELDSAPGDVIVAGRINLNTRQQKVLQALLQGASKSEGGILDSNEAAAAAKALVAWTSDFTTTSSGGSLTKGPLRNRAELVGKFIAPTAFTSPPGLTGSQSPILDPEKSYSGFASVLTTASNNIFSSTADTTIDRRTGCVIRALVDSGNTRTWNLLIDLIAQVGRYPASASSLNHFVVEGETRLWVHLAIDRSTGNVVASIVEPVSE